LTFKNAGITGGRGGVFPPKNQEKPAALRRGLFYVWSVNLA